MGALRLLLGRWRADSALLALLAVVVAVTAGLVGAVPRLLDVLARDSLADELDEVTIDRRGVAADVVREVGFRDVDAAWAALTEAGVELEAEGMGAALADVVAPPVPVVDSLRYSLGPDPDAPTVDPFSRFLTVRTQLDLPPVSLVEGRLPDGEVGSLEVDTGQVDEDGRPVLETLPVHEVVVTAASAEAMGVAAGDRRIAVVDGTGPRVRRIVPTPTGRIVVEVAGIVELAPIDDPAWFGDPRLHRPTQFDTNTTTSYFAFALVPPDVAGELPGAVDRAPAGLTWRWELDEEALLAADPGPVADAALALRTTLSLDVDQPRWSTGLDRLIARERARRATAVEVLGLAVVAVVGVAVALLGAVGVVLATRRRDALALVRGRGTSVAQSLTASAVEAAAVTGIGAALALLGLAGVLPGGGGEELVLGVALLSAVVLVSTTWADATRPLGALLAERRRRTSRPSRGRPVLEGTIVIVAVAAAVAVRQRGVFADGEVDALVVAAPAAVALAAATVATRLVPVLLRLLGPVAVRRRRGLAAPLGVARATRQQRAGPIVLLVTLGLGVAGTALAVQSSLAAGQAAAAQERVGADVRIAAPPLATLSPDWTPPGPDDEALSVSTVDGVVVGGGGSTTVRVVLVDAARFASLTAGLGLPSLAWDGVAPAPMISSSPLAALDDPTIGSGLTIGIDGDRVGVTLAAIRPRLLGLDAADDGRFVVVEEEAVISVTGQAPLATTRLVATDDPDAVVADALAADPDATVLVRRDVQDGIATAPLARGVRVGFAVAAGVVVVATLLAVVLALAAAAPVRRREAAVLAAVGTGRVRIAGVAVAEVLPTVATAAVLGVGLAAGVVWLLVERLDLSAFAGTVEPYWLLLPPVVETAAVTVVVVLAAGAAAIGTIGRVDTAALLREGE